MLKIRMIVCLILVTIVTIFVPCSKITAIGDNTYYIKFDGLKRTYNLYLPSSLKPPTSYKNLGCGMEGLLVKDYPVRLSFNINRSSTKSGYKKKKNPYIKIYTCSANGSVGNNFINITDDYSGVFDLPANSGIYIIVYTGDQKRKPNRGLDGDHDGYSWDLTLKYQYDETPPATPKAPRVSGGIVKGDICYTNATGEVILEWDAVSDHGTLYKNFENTSGINYYNIYGNQGILIKSNVKPVPGQNFVSHALNGSLFTEGQEYGLKIQAVDNENNKSDFGSVTKIVADNDPPQGPTNLTTPNIKSCTNANPVIWTWKPAIDTISGVKQYHITIINKETGAIFKEDMVSADVTSYSCSGLLDQKTYECLVVAEDYVGNLGEVASHTVKIIRTVPKVTLPEHPIKLDNGTLTFTWNPVSIESLGLKEYELAVTESSDPPTVAQDSTTGNSYTKGKYSSRETWYAWVRAVDVLDNRGVWTMAGPFPGFILTGPENALITNRNDHTVNIKSRNGQELKYKAKYRAGSQVFETDTVTAGDLTIGFPFEAEWQWWLEVSEYQDGTEINESKVITEGYTLTLDQTAPTGAITVKSAEGDRICTETEPVNQRGIFLTGLQLNDLSGVKGIILWTGLETTPSADAISYNIEQIPTGGIPWELPDQDGVHQINMLIEDNAGNTTLITYKVALDRVVPGMPQNITHSYTDGFMTFKWISGEPSADIAEYRGTYILPDGIKHPFSVVPSETKEGQYQITETLGANQPIIIKVCSVDGATNQSELVEYTGCTPAKLGKLEYLGTSYDPIEEKHYLTWKLSEPGIAESHILEYGKVIEEVFNPIIEIGADDNGAFIHNTTGESDDKLQPHAIYQYRLVAINKAGDRTYGDKFNQKVDNLPPVKPDKFSLTPVDYASTEPVFDYTEVEDYDNDELTYTVKWIEGTSFDLEAYHTATLEQGKYKIKLDAGKHGTTYSWYLEVKDSEGAVVTSDVVQFVLDANNPELVLEKPKTLYTNLTELKVKVKDDLSGIKTAIYQVGTQESQTIQLSSGSFGEMLGTIPLVEGQYDLKVTAQDHAGNRVSEDVNNLWVDHSQPVLDTSSIVIDLPLKDGVYLTSGKIPMIWSANDNSSGIAGIRYWIISNGETPGQGTYISLSSGLTNYAHNLEISAEKNNGQIYNLEFVIIDKAGNSSIPYRLPQGFLLDNTAPEASLTLSGLYSNGSGLYLTDLENVQVSLIVNEGKSGVNTSFNLIDSTDRIPITAWDNWENVKQTILTPGGKYQVVAKVINGVGLETEVFSEEFTFDNTAPIITELSGPTHPLTTGENFSLNITVDEYETSVVKYRIAIGTEPGTTELTTLLPSNHNGWHELKTNSLQPQIRLEIPEIADGTYYITLEAVNAAGLRAYFNEERILTVNNNQERIVVSDQGPYTMFSDRLTGWWKYNGTKTVISYRFRVLDQDNQIIRDWKNTNDTMVAVDQLQLKNENTYRFEVQTIFEGGLYSESGFSPGVTVDDTAPIITELETPLYTTSNNFGFAWTGKDDCSGISRVLVAVGTDYNQTDITKGWVEVIGNNVKLTRDINGEPLVFDLSNTNRYYLTLRLVNGAGLTAEKIAPAIVVDNSAPSLPIVYDQGGFINTKSEQPLEAHWFWSEADPESGSSYQWTILKYGEKVTPLTQWQEGDDTKRISLNMDQFQREHGETYYFAVKATNGAGLSSIGYSDGIMADATAPYLLKVKVLDAINQSGDEEINYVTDSDKELRLWIDSYDPDSDVAYYLYAWNTLGKIDDTERSSSTEEPISILNPDLVEGAINIFLGETVNQADITSPPGYSTGIVVDSEAPVIKNVRGGVSGDSFLFDWEVETSASPVVRYEYAFVNESKVNFIAESDWKTAEDKSLDRRLTLDASAYQDGRYCLVVRGYNAAGTYSRHNAEYHEWGISNVIILDRIAPEIITAVFPRYADEVLKFSASGVDQGSGIAGYQYALGTVANPFHFSSGWVDLNTTDSTVVIEMLTSSGIIPHNTNVYAMVRVKDKVGLWSEAKVSDKIVIDHTKPETPVITYGRYITNKLLLTGIEYRSVDPESSLANYRVGLTSEIGGAWLATKEGRVQLTPDGELIQLNLDIDGSGLTEAGSYYLALQVQNGTGDWSEIGYSEMVTVDTIEPVLEFVHAGETLVINEPPLSVEYNLSEDAQVKLNITGADGIAKEEIVAGITGVNQYIFNETKPQIYTITAIPIDKAGNVGEGTEQIKQTIRVNKPPVISLLGEIKATVGRSLTLTAEVTDPDGIEGDTFTYEWLPGDGSPALNGATPVYQYAALGEYTLTLTVTDKDGGTATVTSIVKVGNANSGELAVDETWSGIHRIYGDVIIPSGLKLTIQPGTQIFIDGVPGETGYNHALIVKGTLTVGNGTSFSSVTGTAGGWRGILVEGEATLENVTIGHAERGVTALDEATVNLSECTFENNLVGVHAYNSHPVLNSCIFRNNIYGIKEDENGRPTVKGCWFTDNGVDYYHLELTEITLEQVNGLPGNEGNQ